MSFDMRINWTSSVTRKTLPLNDCISISINKSTEIKNNICNITLKNAAVQTNTEPDGTVSVLGEYVTPDTKLLKFNHEDSFRVWASFLTDASEVGTEWYDDDRLIGAFALKEFTVQTMGDQTRVGLKAVDIAYLLFNSIYTFEYGISNKFTAPGIIRNCARKFGEAGPDTLTKVLGTPPDDGTEYEIDARFVSEGGSIDDYRRIRTSTDPDVFGNDQETTLNGSISDSDTTISLASTSGFEDAGDATVVIGTEHVSYTGVSGNNLTDCTRGIDDTVAASHSSGVTVLQGFPLQLMSKIWKPLFEWIGELSQTENTNYLSEVQEGGTLYFNRAFLFWIDKHNSPHWVYPDNTIDLTIDLGEEGRRAFNLQKAVFDAVNFIIYNCGEDMYGNGIIHYLFDDTTEIATMKMRYQPMSKIVHTLVLDDRNKNTTRNTSNPDIFKQFPSSGSYPVVPSFLDDANKFRARLGKSALTDVDNDSEYNSMLREACKERGWQEAKKITTKRSGFRYRGSIAMKGVHVNPGDLVDVTNAFVGLNSQKLRVLGVRHNINMNGWETVLELEEDEKTET